MSKITLSLLILSLCVCPMVPAATIRVDPNQVVNASFLGVGAEYDPFNYMPEGIRRGYNDAYNEWEMLLVSRMALRFARMHFQPDWFMKGWGVYDFDSPRMQAVYRYLDTLQASGTFASLTYGWKISREAQDWYGFADPNVNPKESAPRDLDGYAAGASELINHLINVKKYTNVKFLTSYNEPDGGDFDLPPGMYPALGSGPPYLDQAYYYVQLMLKMHQKLVADGRRGLVQIWGPEETDKHIWTEFVANSECHKFWDLYTGHCYPHLAIADPGAGQI